MKARRRLSPSAWSDRFAAASFVFLAFAAAYEYGARGPLAGASMLLSGLGFLFVAYVLQDRPALLTSEQQHKRVLDELDQIRAQIGSIGEFLHEEQRRVAEARETIEGLRKEQSGLQPVVESNRRTVEAILAAHVSNIRRAAWKERIIGFSLGILASFIASFLYEWVKRQ